MKVKQKKSALLPGLITVLMVVAAVAGCYRARHRHARTDAHDLTAVAGPERSGRRRRFAYRNFSARDGTATPGVRQDASP